MTSSAIDVGVGPGLCIAIDPRDPRGAWWWEPGASVDVRLRIEDGRMRSLATGAVVALQHHDDLELPEWPPGAGPH